MKKRWRWKRGVDGEPPPSKITSSPIQEPLDDHNSFSSDHNSFSSDHFTTTSCRTTSIPSILEGPRKPIYFPRLPSPKKGREQVGRKKGLPVEPARWEPSPVKERIGLRRRKSLATGRRKLWEDARMECFMVAPAVKQGTCTTLAEKRCPSPPPPMPAKHSPINLQMKDSSLPPTTYNQPLIFSGF